MRLQYIDTRDMDLFDAVQYRLGEESKASLDYVNCIKREPGADDDAELNTIRAAFYDGIAWERRNQWYPCDGDILPPYDMSVIVRLVDEDSGEYFGETFMHRSKNPDVYKDSNDWALIVRGMKHTHWCYVPEFYN